MSWADVPVTAEHAALLQASAVLPEVALAAGVRSVGTVADLPEGHPDWWTHLLPGLLYRWTHRGVTEYQLATDDREANPDRRYVFRNGAGSVLHEAVAPADDAPVLIVEGTKQTLAAAGYALDGVGVYGIAGCWGWSGADLSFLEARDVVVIFDGDMTENRNVYDAAAKLGKALAADGASSTRFVELPTTGKDGLDDLLGRTPPDKRAAKLGRLIGAAGALPRRPPARSKTPSGTGESAPRTPVADGDRVEIDLGQDRLHVINQVLGALERWNATRLFSHGGVLSQLDGDSMKPLTRNLFGLLVQESAITFQVVKGARVFCWPESGPMGAALTQADRFAQLDMVARAPFLREDGTVCAAAGYDEPSRTLLLLDGDLGPVVVPENPTPAQRAAALRLLTEEWLVDFLADMESDADRANCLALALTPLIRGLVPLAPLAVLDGLQMGVGKGRLVGMISIVATGHDEEPLPYGADDAETRKVITSAFRSGASMFAFDEAHVLEGGHLARALTSVTYSDRILGDSTLAKFPNGVTWISMGNQVEVRGDITRRVYRISLRPKDADPHLRPTHRFRHPQPEWTREHRAELLTALLTLARAWYAAGKPWTPSTTGFGSFEPWERMVGGILQHAGVTGFLDNAKTWRSESDFDRSYWSAHLQWLRATFGDREFTAGQVRSAMVSDPDHEAPPRMVDPSVKGYARELGKAYARQRDKVVEGLMLAAVPGTRSRGHPWTVQRRSAAGEDCTGGVDARLSDGATDSPTPYPMGGCDGATGASIQPSDERFLTCPSPQHSQHRNGREGAQVDAPVAPSHPPMGCGVGVFDAPSRSAMGRAVVALDVETGPAENLWQPDPGFVRLAGYAVGGRPVTTTTDIDRVVQLVQAADRVVGHNLFGFDLLALARHRGLDLNALAARGAIVDTLLLAYLDDPPPSQLKRGERSRRYDLDAVGGRLLGQTKHGDLKALKREFGGYDKIPTDDPRYVEYLRGDVEISARVAEVLLPMSAYAVREHRLAAIAARISLSGFRVDTSLLAKRQDEGHAARAECEDQLRCCYQIPSVSTDEGKRAIAAAFTRVGVTDIPKTSTGKPATGRAAMERLARQYPGAPAELAALILAANGIRTVYGTIAAHLVGDRVHPLINMRQVGGRWSFTNPGLGVMGKRGGRVVEREVLLPEPGHVIVCADLAQIDARALAALSQDGAYLQLFEPGRDIHAEVAAQIWGDRGRREDAKAISHGWNYGRGIRGIVEQAGVTEDVARQFDAGMRERFGRLVEWRDEVRERAASGELLDNGFGRMMRPNPEMAWTQGPALMGQGCARDLMMQGLLRLPVDVLPMLRAMIHDEVVLSVPVDIVDDVEKTVIQALSFEWAPPGQSRSVQVIADVGQRGASWGHAYAKNPVGVSG